MNANRRTGKFTREFGETFVTQVVCGTFSVPGPPELAERLGPSSALLNS